MPELLLRVATDHAPPPGHATTRDVVVAIDDDHRIGDLVATLAGHCGVLVPERSGLVVARTGRHAPPEQPVGVTDLLAGDLVVLGARFPSGRPAVPARALALDITAGPDSGSSIVLRTGAITIGRSSASDVVLGDAAVSRRHAVITVGPQGGLAVVAERGSRNGVLVGGDPIVPGVPTEFGCGDVLTLGGTTMVVRRFERCDTERRDRLAQVDFHRTPYRPPVVVEREPDPVGPVPTRPQPRRLQLVAVVAPLVAGVAMYAMTKQAQFLLFTLISPVVMVGTAIDDRRSGRRTFRADLAAFRGMLAERRAEFERLRSLEAVERHRAAPDLADLVRRAELRTIDLWPRDARAPDFLHLRLGLGPDSVSFPVEIESDGDPDLRAEAVAALVGVSDLNDVPITVDLAHHLLGVHGDPELVDGVAASLLVQAATLHSPDDVAIAVAVSPERRFGWTKWLPHLRSVTSPVAGSHLATTSADADALVGRLLEVAAFRRAQRGHDVVAVHRPRVLVVLDADLGADPAAVSRLLDVALDVSISVIWLATDAAAVPRHADRILDVRTAEDARMTGRLWATDPSVVDRDLDVEHLRRTLAERVARALAPIRDASTASLATSIPRAVPLLDVLGVTDVDTVAARWLLDDGYHLRFPIGRDADGPLELDLVHDGPHTLIGGTSGAGKSELLQSMVAGLAARHSPERLNFLFVDYKGGASSQVFERLPHTVGTVTNLTADLATRALTSLRTELDRRMTVLDGRAKDLAEMLDRHPDEAPASLVIVIDEFATLVREVPDFVAGVVDIAQRGRSLGIHLVLATQRPTGSVNENILANTNLRISLRMLDRAESTAIIGSPDAADIPVPLRGRGLVRMGPRALVEFQSAFAGASLAVAGERTVRVGEFDGPDATPLARHVEVSSGAPTHLDVVVDAIVAANVALGLPAPRRPWREVLPDVVHLAALLDDPDAVPALEHPGRSVVVGMLDAPEAQEQRPAVLDLEHTGGLLVHGSGGAGKTTLLRTIAVGVDQGSADSTRGAVTLVFDFASRGLASLHDLPSVVDVVTGDDLEAATRHLLHLDAELERRRRLLAGVGAEHLTAYLASRSNGGADLDRIVLLVDGFGGLAAALGDGASAVVSAGAERWYEILHRLVIDGRQVGIHTVLTVDRRAAVPPRIQSAIGARLVLRHADPQSYADLGIRAERAATLDAAPGRALLDGSVVVQIASVSVDPTARGQVDEVTARGRIAVEADVRRSTTLRSAPLPDVLSEPPEIDAGRAAAVIGLADVVGEAAILDVEWSHAAVVGPARSGRSTALAAFVRGLAAGSSCYVLGPASSPLRHGDVSAVAETAFGNATTIAPTLDRAANIAMVTPAETPVVVVVDDLDAFVDPTLLPIWERLIAADGARLVASLDTRSMSGYTANPAIAELRRSRRMIVLQPDDPNDFLQLTGIKLPVRPGLRLPPGRGVLLVDRRPTIVQVVDTLGRALVPGGPGR